MYSKSEIDAALDFLETLKTESMEDRMKSYEKKSRSFVNPEGLIVMRIDGKNFSKYTSKLKRPFDTEFMEDMNETAAFLCSEIQGAIMAYVQSDEISLLLTDFDKITTDAWFDGNIQKVVSVSAAMAAAFFNNVNVLLSHFKFSSV